MSDTDSGTSGSGTPARAARQGDRPSGSVLVRARWGHAFATGHDTLGIIDEHTPVAVTPEAAEDLVRDSGGVLYIVDESQED
jgi:hypothetical protein